MCEPAVLKCTWKSDESHLRENVQEKCCAPRSRKSRAGDFMRASAHARICNKNAGDQKAYPNLTPAGTLAVRTPQCGHAVWGIKNAETLLWAACGQPCKTLLDDTLAVFETTISKAPLRSCGMLLWDAPVGRSCGTLLWDSWGCICTYLYGIFVGNLFEDSARQPERVV